MCLVTLVCLVCFFGIIKSGCVFYTYTTVFFNEKGQSTVNFRYPIFAGLPPLHYGAASLRLPTYSAQATRLRHAITVLTPLPAHSNAQIIWIFQSFVDILALDLQVNGFVRFCTLRHSYPPDGPLVERKPDSKESGIRMIRLSILLANRWGTLCNFLASSPSITQSKRS